MGNPTTFNGKPHEVVMSYHVPEQIIKEHGIDLNRTIVPILDINSLADYGTEDSEIGGYYASRSELVLLFYIEVKHRSLMEGADPSYMVPYKDDGDAEFIFDHFTFAWDKKTVFAVYKYNGTIKNR